MSEILTLCFYTYLMFILKQLAVDPFLILNYDKIYLKTFLLKN